jgi:hypothetical protein
MRIESASSSNGMTTVTGPNTSSCPISYFGSTSYRVVGSIKKPRFKPADAPPPVSTLASAAFPRSSIARIRRRQRSETTVFTSTKSPTRRHRYLCRCQRSRRARVAESSSAYPSTADILTQVGINEQAIALLRACGRQKSTQQLIDLTLDLLKMRGKALDEEHFTLQLVDHVPRQEVVDANRYFQCRGNERSIPENSLMRASIADTACLIACS